MSAAAEPSLEVTVGGLKFRNPFLVAAGPPGRDSESLISCVTGGAGGLVAKTISTTAAVVPRPCMARPSNIPNTMMNAELWSDLTPETWISREYPATRLGAPSVPLLASVGYSAADMESLVPRVDPLVDGFEFSCHYTDLSAIRALAATLRRHTRKPIFAKLSPHGHDLVALARSLLEAGVTGFVVMNSLGPALAFDIDSQRPMLGGSEGKGWVSGIAVRPIAVHWVAQLAKALPEGTPIIGVGGVTTWRDAVEFFLAGASAVQVCTAAIYKGPRVFGELAQGLRGYLKEKGLSSVAELRGRGLRYLVKEPNLEPGVSSCKEEKCVHCGQCQTVCAYSAITVSKEKKEWKVDSGKCYGCGLCTTVCPRSALSLVPRK